MLHATDEPLASTSETNTLYIDFKLKNENEFLIHTAIRMNLKFKMLSKRN